MVTIKEGDLITTYYKGYFRLKRIEGDTCIFTQEYDLNGNIKKSKEMICGLGWCELATKHIKRELENMLEKKYKLERILNEK